jgi:hypothetical protein
LTRILAQETYQKNLVPAKIATIRSGPSPSQSPLRTQENVALLFTQSGLAS